MKLQYTNTAMITMQTNKTAMIASSAFIFDIQREDFWERIESFSQQQGGHAGEAGLTQGILQLAMSIQQQQCWVLGVL